MADTVIDILEELESTPGRLDKEEIAKGHAKNDLFKRVVATANDPDIVFYVSKFKVPTASTKRRPESSDAVVQTFLNTLGILARRELTGNEAKDRVVSDFADMTTLEQKWCQRILLKNLRCGVHESIVEKTWPGLVKKFAVQLAETVDSHVSPEGDLQSVDDLTYPIAVDPKLDGLRLIAIKRAGTVTLYTRNGTVLETLPRIQAAIQALDFDDFVLDGEGMADNAGVEAWNRSAEVMMARKTKKDDSSMAFNVFDAMPLSQWNERTCTMIYKDRLEFAKILLHGVDPCVRMLNRITVGSFEELKAFYVKCLDEGYEGVMLKDLTALYKFKRSKGVKKLKPIATHEGIVVGHYEGNLGAKREGLFGGFEVLLPNGVVTNVGGGFTDKLKAQIQLEGPDTYLGRIVECECQPPLTEDGKMRFPVFTRFRDPSDVDPKVLEAFEKWEEQMRAEHGVVS